MKKEARVGVSNEQQKDDQEKEKKMSEIKERPRKQQARGRFKPGSG